MNIHQTRYSEFPRLERKSARPASPNEPTSSGMLRSWWRLLVPFGDSFIKLIHHSRRSKSTKRRISHFIANERELRFEKKTRDAGFQQNLDRHFSDPMPLLSSDIEQRSCNSQKA